MNTVITTQIKYLTTPSTTQWGDAMRDFVKLFSPVVAIAVTVYVFSKDVIKRPSLLIDFLFAKPEVSDEITLHSDQIVTQMVETPAPVETTSTVEPPALAVVETPVEDIPEVQPVEVAPEPKKALRRRATRKRGLSEIESLTA